MADIPKEGQILEVWECHQHTCENPKHYDCEYDQAGNAIGHTVGPQ